MSTREELIENYAQSRFTEKDFRARALQHLAEKYGERAKSIRVRLQENERKEIKDGSAFQPRF